VDPRLSGRLEVVVVDDGSTDATRRIAARYAARMPERFVVVSQENGGHGAAVNAGLHAARGKYFRIVDADDWVDADGLCALLDSMEALDPDVFVDERVERFADRSNQIELPEGVRTDEVIDYHELIDPLFDRNVDMHTLTVRASLLRERGISLLSHTCYVDMQYVIGVACFAHTACLIRRAVYNYRLGAVGQSVNYLNFARNYEQHNRVLLACVDFFRGSEPFMSEGRAAYVRRLLALLTNTQYNIAYIYNPDRREGKRQAQSLSRYLNRHIPWLSRATMRRRMAGQVLHTLGVGYDQLQWLKAAAGRR
jgi:glycosyltransferase involved in cell wall biosynthesis